MCRCATGFSGSQCNYQCPTGATNPTGGGRAGGGAAGGTVACSGHGTCTSKQASGTSEEKGYCQCDETHTGLDCSATCPLGLDGKSCSGDLRGTCSLIDGSGTCGCLEGYAGIACEGYSGCPNGCSGHGTCGGGEEKISEKACMCDAGWVGAGCALECPVTSLSGEVCDGKGTCSALDGKPICTCEGAYVGDVCQFSCDGSDSTTNDAAAAAANASSVCGGQGTCVVSEKDPKDGSAIGAACACLDGWGGATCTESPIAQQDRLIEQAQDKIDSKSTVIAVVVTLVSLTVIGVGALLYRRQRTRLRQYEVTFGTDALLGPESEGGGGGGGGGGGRGRQVRRGTRTESDSLAAEDVLARGSMAVQMQEITVVESEAEI